MVAHVAMAFASVIKCDIEKFVGRMNFGLWQTQVKDVLIQYGLHKVLKGKPFDMKEEEWEELDLRAVSAIRLCLAKNVLANVQKISTTKELWERLEGLYQAKGISNWLLLKEKFHNLRMSDDMKVSDHLSNLNEIVCELEAIRVKVEEEDISLRLIWSLPSSYKLIKLVLMYGKETLSFDEIASKILCEERRMKSNENMTTNSIMVVRSGTHGNKNHKMNVVCWQCGKPGHVRKYSRGGDTSQKNDSDSTKSVSLIMGDNDLL